MKKNFIPFLSILAIASAVALPALSDDGDRDHERARNALKAGEILPLRDILDTVSSRFEGEMIEVELEQEKGRWLYEVKLLAPGGRVLEVEIDAKTREVIEVEGAKEKD